MSDQKDDKEPVPIGQTASIIHESRKAGEALLGADPQKAQRWMVFVIISAVLVLSGFLGVRSITSFETVVSMILRSKEDQADRDRQHYSAESEKVRQHCSKETELAAAREQSRTDRTAAMFTEERNKDRISGEMRDRMIRDELIALRIILNKKLPVPPDDNDAAVKPIPKINSGGQ